MTINNLEAIILSSEEILVTGDSRLKLLADDNADKDIDDCFPKTDFDVLKKLASKLRAAEVAGLMSEKRIDLTPDLCEDIGIKIQKASAYFNGKASAIMTDSLAKFVRTLRKANFTWRSIALEINDKINGDWGSNQLMGIELCESAAKLLGEDPNSEPWN